jgi:putative SOS response-associated peptidase YedK
MVHLRPQFGLCSETMTVMCRLWINSKDSEDQFANVAAGAEVLKPPPNEYLQRWPVSKRVNSSKADADDATLIERVELAAV